MGIPGRGGRVVHGMHLGCHRACCPRGLGLAMVISMGTCLGLASKPLSHGHGGRDLDFVLGVGPDGHIASLFPGHKLAGEFVSIIDATGKKVYSAKISSRQTLISTNSLVAGIYWVWLGNESSLDLVIKSMIAHLWFVTIHPFDDGNGRIARAMLDMFLAKSDHSKIRFYSLSNQIFKEHKKYNDIIEKAQKGAGC